MARSTQNDPHRQSAPEVGNSLHDVRAEVVGSNESLFGHTEPLEGQMRARPGRQVPELTELSALEQMQGDQRVAVVNLYKAIGGSWKRKDEAWRAPK
jgi:hypothetical protein